MRTLSYLLIAMLATAAQAARVKDVVSIEGIRDNQLVGYGVVVGLNGTGDKRQTYFSSQTLANLLDRMGVQVPAAAMLVRNTAAVIITANLPPFAQTGSRIDVEVAAIGDATNLQGGLLVLTPLKSATGQVYAVAQGSVVTGGFVAGRGSGNSTTVNHPTAGRIMSGAIVEKLAPNVMPPAGGSIRLQLRRTDFTTAARLADAVNARFKADLAKCENAGVVAVSVPPERAARLVEFISEIEELNVMTDMPSRIIINERTGTITAGREIRLRPVSILHGALSVEVQTSYDVSQPAPFSEGKTTTVPEVKVGVKEEAAKSIQLRQGGTIDDLVKALTAIGSTPRDVIAILQNLKSAGAFDAEIEVI